MKKSFAALLALCLMLLPAVPARADAMVNSPLRESSPGLLFTGLLAVAVVVLTLMLVKRLKKTGE